MHTDIVRNSVKKKTTSVNNLALSMKLCSECMRAFSKTYNIYLPI